MSRSLIESGLNMVYGSYRGNGLDGRIIEIGFSPDLVIIRPETAQYSVFRTSSHVGDDTSYFSNAAANFADGIQSFVASGFTIGANATVNTNGTMYHYIAFKNSNLANFAVGSYTGNGSDSRNITGLGFQPDLVWIKRNGASIVVFRDSLDVGDLTHQPGTAGYIADAIQSLISDGFQVGTNAAVNTNSDVYYYFAFKASTKFALNSYTGDGTDDRSITGVGFDPDVVFVKRDGASVGGGANSGILRTRSMIGDLSGVLSNSAITTNFIQSLVTGGFQIGSNVSVNDAVSPTEYHYYAFKGHRMRITA